jgi:hypothetical protein
MKNIWPMVLRPITATPNQRAAWLPRQYAERGEDLQRAEDERDPAPRAQVADHVMRVGDEYVRVGDRGNAVDQVEEAYRQQQHHREDDHPIAFALARSPGAPHCRRRHFGLPRSESPEFVTPASWAVRKRHHPYAGDSTDVFCGGI